ncbi:1-acyl-sn-glycerol-3-phosphate acyltransferase gamma-like [Dysidea avara]|uniref:1-acyl-sn-glycerol-3-phosphate acyltransferase gamma-like n=1 Tax=Dysidea avara TaxID=196820 RepID=UPI0033218DF0
MMSLAWIIKSRVIVIPLMFTFMLIGLITNLFQALCLPLWWIGQRQLYRRINTWIVYWFWCVLPWALESWAGYTVNVYGDVEVIKKYQNSEHAICVLNHRGDLDWMIGWVMIERAGMLGGAKAFLKDSTKYLPVVGWSFWLMEFPMLKRNWEHDEQCLSTASARLADYPIKMLMCIFPEGSRFTVEKHEASKQFCKERGLQPLKHHLYPRTKGFSYAVKNMDYVGAVYDVTFGFKEGEPSILGVMNAEPCQVDMLIRRIDIKDVPTSNEKESSKWLVDIFREKDDLVDYYNEHQRFPPEYELTTITKRPWARLVVSIWLTLLTLPMMAGLVYTLIFGSWTVLIIVGAILFIVNYMFRRLCKATAERSQHGLTTNRRYQ